MSENNEDKDMQESIDDLLKRVQVLKIENELKESNKNYFKKYIYPELPKYFPALFLGVITLWITTSKDIIGTKEDKLSIREDKVGMSEKALEMKKIETRIENLKKEENTKSENVIQLDKDYMQKLNEIKELSNRVAQTQIQYENEKKRAQDLQNNQFLLQNKNKSLLNESNEIRITNLTESIYYNPNISNKFVYEAIELIETKSENSKKLIKEIETNIKKGFHKPLNYFILYYGTQDKKYFKLILDGISQMCGNRIGVFSNAEMNELLNMLLSNRFKKDEHKEISFTIINNLKFNSKIENVLIQYLTLPSYYYREIYNFDQSFLEDSYWISYIALYNKVIHNVTTLENKTNYNNIQNISSDFLNDKKSLIFSLFKTFPQVAYSYYLDYMCKVDFNNVADIQSENAILAFYIADLNSKEYTSCKQVYYNFFSSEIGSYPDESKTMQTSVIFQYLKDLNIELNSYKKKNKVQMEKWLDENMTYFNEHKKEFRNKLTNCEL